MVAELIVWLWIRFRPKEGWLPFFLLAAAVGCLVAAVLDVGWVPERRVVLPTAVFGLLLGVVLAKRPIRPFFAWSLLTVYSLLLTLSYLAHLLPPIEVLTTGWAAVRPYWLGQLALFFDRAGSWFIAVWAGNRSEETIIFAWGLGIGVWFLSAYAGWSTFRQQRPLLGLTLIGVALAVNGYFGVAPVWWAATFVSLAGPLAAIMHYVYLSQEWDKTGVDYSAEIQVDLALYATGIGTAVLLLSLALPTFSITRLARAFQEQPVVKQAEQTLQRVFAGVEQPRQEAETSPGGPGGSGVLPRTYLLGNAPELYETVVMTATTSDLSGFPNLTGLHWRGLSYDVYTGRGWARSEERQETIPADTPIPLPPLQSQVTVEQKVHWLFDRRLLRYTLGQPVQIDQQVDVFWRGLEDLVRVQGVEEQYQALSQLTAATPDELRGTAVSDIPPALLARYTALPAVPTRVRDLALQVAGQTINPYDQARAIEQFLRQYPYSLDVPMPPETADPVEFFLFELQTGYCDYYASAMVVMARSLGLPARLATGYLAQPPDENGVQTIYQINGHSWAEIYFAGYGWVEFEPTAAFPTSLSGETAAFAFPDAPTPIPVIPPPIPEPDRRLTIPWARLGLLGLLVVGIGLVGWRMRNVGEQDVIWAYGRLQSHARHLGQSTPPSQTPNEFLRAFHGCLEGFGRHPRLIRIVQQVRSTAEQLTHLFIRRQYAGEQNGETARPLWQNLGKNLYLLRLAQKIYFRLQSNNHRK